MADELDPVALITGRKADHVELALGPGGGARDPGWDDVHLVPRSVPEVSVHDVDLRTDLLGLELAAPVVLAPMTGGYAEGGELNAVLGEAAQHLGLAVGVGSQRVALAHPELAPTFAAVRRRAPDVPVIANVGAVQLVDQGAAAPLGAADLVRAIDMVGASVLSIHLNVVQELIQPEGDRNTTGLVDAVARAVEVSPVPVLAKETGAGMTRLDAVALVGAGVGGLDVGGAGGTSFATIEARRAEAVGDEVGRGRGEALAEWGLPTAASVLEVRGAGVPVIATGGVRHGLDAARALALGATAVGLGRVAIEAARRGPDALIARLETFLDVLRASLVLCGASRPADLRGRPDAAPVLTGFTAEWARQRGLLAVDG